MNEIQIIENEEFGEVRTTVHNGEIAFVAKDVAERLGYTWQVNVIKHVPDEWKGVIPINTLGGVQEMAVLTEQGLYFFLARSDKPRALPFQKWIAGEVMPSIRKYGAYLTPAKIEEVLLNPDTIIRLATELKTEREQRVMLEEKVERDKPKVLFADAVAASDGTILIGEMAKILKQNGIDIGPYRFFEILRQDGFLIKCGRRDSNIPTQKAMELGLFRVKETAVSHSDGRITVHKTPKVTGKGQQYFLNMFMANHKTACC